MKSYIDVEYYKNFSGDTKPPEDIEVILQRASDIVDQITYNRIISIDTWNKPTQELIKKAIAALAEYAVSNGGLYVLINGAPTYGGNVRIGSFGYGDGRVKTSNDNSDSRVPSSVLQYLLPTGLLDKAIGGVGCG